MGRNTFLEILLLFIIVLDGCNAFFGWEHRKLAGLDPNKNKIAVQDPLSPTPLAGEKNSDSKPDKQTKTNETDPASTNNSPKVEPKGLNNPVSQAFPPVAKVGNETVDPNGLNTNNSTPASPPSVTKRNDEKGHEKEKDEGKSSDKKNEKNERNAILQSKTNKSCNGLSPSCNDHSKMVGCIFERGVSPCCFRSFFMGSYILVLGYVHCHHLNYQPGLNPEAPFIGLTYLVVLVQNGEESATKVNIFSMESNFGLIEVAKHRTTKINITLNSSGVTKVTLNAGHGDCDLQMGTPVPEGKFFVRLLSYEKLLTPVKGAYFLIITVIVFGGTWACCKCRTKKRHDNGIQYQELEMALPESAANVETADGWDQGWDDDWDEDMAVKSPGRHVGSISANGLTSRSSNKDGWENN